MNDKLQETVNDILLRAVDAASAGADFLKEQMPDVLQQLLLWKIGQNAFVLVLSLIALFVCYRLARYFLKESYDEFPAFMICTFVGVPSLVATVCTTFQLLQLWLAPKVWLLEYAASLVRK